MQRYKIAVYLLFIPFTAFGILSKQPSSATDSNRLTMLVGTYTSGASKGIYTFYFDQSSGVATSLSETAITNPSFMTVSADGKRVYALSEGDKSNSAVAVFDFDVETGVLNLRHKEKTHSAAPCYILEGGYWLATANYGGGEITTFPLDRAGDIQPLRQQIGFGRGDDSAKSHLHCLQFSPDKKYVFACDLGRDSIYRFAVNTKKRVAVGEPILKSLEPAISVADGSGPRHLTFTPNGKYAYLINEMGGTVIAFRYTKGYLTEIQTIVADSVGGNGSADIHISPDGEFLYASNRLKEDGIAIFSIDSISGLLTRVGYCNTAVHPRNFCISPNGKYLLVACRDSDVVQIYKRDKKTGLLIYMGRDMDIKLDSPVFVQLVC